MDDSELMKKSQDFFASDYLTKKVRSRDLPIVFLFSYRINMNTKIVVKKKEIKVSKNKTLINLGEYHKPIS